MIEFNSHVLGWEGSLEDEPESAESGRMLKALHIVCKHFGDVSMFRHLL